MKVLHVIPTFFPATYWGGPIYSTLGLCSALAKMPGVSLRVLTTDAAGPHVDDRVSPMGNPQIFPEGFEVHYCVRRCGRDVAPTLIAELPGLVRWADVVHLTGVYSFPTLPTLLVTRLMRRALVWSPRGALQRWDRTSRRKAKLLWERLCSSLIDPRRTVLHCTSEIERVESLQRISKAPAMVIPNGMDTPILETTRREFEKGKTIQLMYIGRIDPKKGIENLISAIATMPAGAASLRIYGTGDAHYVARLEQLVRTLEITDSVLLAGHVDGDRKAEAFDRADVCVVPSHTENFGIVVLEALVHGVPVIASTGTPWSALESKGCGLWVENAPASIAAAIKKIQTMDLALMGSRGREWVEQEFGWESIAGRMHDVYSSILENAIKT